MDAYGHNISRTLLIDPWKANSPRDDTDMCSVYESNSKKILAVPCYQSEYLYILCEKIESISLISDPFNSTELNVSALNTSNWESQWEISTVKSPLFLRNTERMREVNACRSGFHRSIPLKESDKERVNNLMNSKEIDHIWVELSTKGQKL